MLELVNLKGFFNGNWDMNACKQLQYDIIVTHRMEVPCAHVFFSPVFAVCDRPQMEDCRETLARVFLRPFAVVGSQVGEGKKNNHCHVLLWIYDINMHGPLCLF